jgi:ribose-phosphate pyrophosphokinase
LSGPAFDRIRDAEIDGCVVTNTIAVDEAKAKESGITILSVAPMFANAIRNVHTNKSVSELFDPEFQI